MSDSFSSEGTPARRSLEVEAVFFDRPGHRLVGLDSDVESPVLT